ncbi:hypothetical protein CR513_60814, partial [Mucuna pruriens]
MCGNRGALVVATTVGVVETLKDQGYCKMNNTMKSVAQQAKNQIGSATQAKKLASPSASSNKLRDEKRRKAEESLRTVIMSSRSRAWTWTVAASVGVVEALKDQGVCRWNSVMKSAQQHAKHNMRSLSQAKKLSDKLKDEKVKQSEESLRTVMLE